MKKGIWKYQRMFLGTFIQENDFLLLDHIEVKSVPLYPIVDIEVLKIIHKVIFCLFFEGKTKFPNQLDSF